MSGRQLHLNVNLLHSGVYPSAWRLPESRPDAFIDIDHFIRVARIAERGKLDAIFLADTPAINGHRIVVGTPEAIADDIEAWFRAGAADGFNLMPDVLPEGLETFVDAVVPILQRRGLFRQDYAGATLRDHLGLARPASRYAATGHSLLA